MMPATTMATSSQDQDLFGFRSGSGTTLPALAWLPGMLPVPIQHQVELELEVKLQVELEVQLQLEVERLGLGVNSKTAIIRVSLPVSV